MMAGGVKKGVNCCWFSEHFSPHSGTPFTNHQVQKFNFRDIHLIGKINIFFALIEVQNEIDSTLIPARTQSSGTLRSFSLRSISAESRTKDGNSATRCLMRLSTYFPTLSKGPRQSVQVVYLDFC